MGDFADAESIRSYELYEAALIALAVVEDGIMRPVGSLAHDADSLLGDNSVTTMKRTAVINIARTQGMKYVMRMQKVYPGIDLLRLVKALRVKAVELRLGGDA